MNLSEGIEQYVAHRRTEGITFKTGEESFLKFFEMVGNVEMQTLSTVDVTHYLAHFEQFPDAWQNRFCLLERFLNYWIVRGEILPLPMPPRRVRSLTKFLPYVFNVSVRRVPLDVGRVTQQVSA